jgi:hypothetical protein
MPLDKSPKPYPSSHDDPSAVVSDRARVPDLVSPWLQRGPRAQHGILSDSERPSGRWCPDVSSFAPSIGQRYIPQYKPVVGDFNGDGVDDIFWYRPNLPDDEDQVDDDRVWLLMSSDFPTGITVVPANIAGDFTPIVGNFDITSTSAECEDILWFAPHTAFQSMDPTDGDDDELADERGESPLWKSDCDGTFTTLESQPTPNLAYPVGYDPRQGRTAP